MKNLIYIVLSCLFIVSCEEVIDLELPTAKPKLVIDASINWFKGTTGNEQKIKLTLTAPYFNSDIPPANNATVTIIDTNNNTFNFVEEGNTGIYKNNTFLPVLNNTYTLSIIYNNESYIATETLTPVSSIESIEQKNNGGFSGKDIEIKAFYTDPANQKNFYLFEFTNNTPPLSSLSVYKDEFTNGNKIFAFYSEKDLESDNILTIKNYGVSKRYYEFMFILIQQSENKRGNPFETQPATLRGNCVNKTSPDNFPLGYFRVSEADAFIYTLE